MKALLLTSYILLLASGLIALARFLHPATFSPGQLWLVLLLVFISAIALVLPLTPPAGGGD